MNAAFILFDPNQILNILIPYGNDQPPSRRQLIDQRLRDDRCTRSHDNCVKGTLFPPPAGSVGIASDDVVIFEIIEQPADYLQDIAVGHGL